MVPLATTKERDVALATDEMKGYSDKNTNYRNSFSKTSLSFFRQIAADTTGTVLI